MSATDDLTSQLAKAIRAAWVDRLDWDELAQGALEFLTSTGRLIPAGGMALAAEDVRKFIIAIERHYPEGEAELLARLRALVPATEPAEVTGQDFLDAMPTEPDCWDVCEGHPAPAEPAEEETKAELCAVRLCVLPARHSGVHADREGLRWNNPTSSPVVPAPTETGPWPTWQEVLEGVWYQSGRDRVARAVWMNIAGIRYIQVLSDGVAKPCVITSDYMVNYAPFVAAEEG